MAENEQASTVPVFRARKKRRLLPRQDEANNVVKEAVHTPDAAAQDRQGSLEELPASTGINDDDASSGHDVVLKKAKRHQPRRMGLHFKPFDAVAAARQREESGAVAINQPPKDLGDPLLTINRRFAPQSGHHAVSSDKYMLVRFTPDHKIEVEANRSSNAYVEREFARLQGRPLPDAGGAAGDSHTFSHSTEQQTAQGDVSGAMPDPVGDPASLTGLDHEKPARPDLAQTRAVAGDDSIDIRAVPGRTKQTRRTRPPRHKEQERTEADRRRDEAVEAVLSEAKLDIFEERKVQTQYTGVDGEADEQMAAEYKRAFLEALQNRSAPRKPPVPPNVGKDQPKGPKLGGSRSARAAMHAKERADAAKKR